MKFEHSIKLPAPVLLESNDDIEAALRRCFVSEALAVDTETLGRKYGKLEDQILYAGISPDEGARYFVPRAKLYRFKSLLEDEDIVKVLHNFKFDQHRFENAGITLKGPIGDTWVMDWLYDEDTRENRHSLEKCCLDYFDLAMDSWKDIVGKDSPSDIVPGHPSWPRMLCYGTKDAWATRRLYHHLKSELEKVYLDKSKSKTLMDLYWETEQEQLKCLYEMERRGINVDRPYLESMSTRLSEQMNQHAKQICKLANRPLNPASPKQIGEFLFGEQKLEPIKFTGSGAPSCDVSVLTHFAEQGNEFCAAVLKHRKAGKLKGTYADGLVKRIQPSGHIHTTYSPVKLTGRLGSSDPNMQNIPRPSSDPEGIRASFIPDEGCVLIVADYAQLEMRLMAHFSGDEAMVEGICAGRDMHSYTASLMMKIPYEEFMSLKAAKDEGALATRQAAKAVGFGIIYCIGAPKLAENLTKALGRGVNVEEAQAYLDAYLEAFPAVKRQIKRFKTQAKTRGYVQTISGRYRRLSKVKSRNFRERGHAERQAVNSPIQGSAADIVKKAMLKCWRSEKLAALNCTLRLQVHDELAFNCPKENAEEAVKLIQQYMENPLDKPLRVPLPAEPVIVNNWKEAK